MEMSKFMDKEWGSIRLDSLLAQHSLRIAQFLPVFNMRLARLLFRLARFVVQCNFSLGGILT